MRGFVKEDVSQGHSLMADSTARMIQLRFVDLAAKHRDSLRAVLRTSDDENHRAFAAEVLAYSANKQSVVEDLVYAMRDPSGEVRNNATRALALIAIYGRQHPDLKIDVPYEPFIDLLNSVAWTDRNKASLALMQLTESRDPKLLAALKTRAFDAVVEDWGEDDDDFGESGELGPSRPPDAPLFMLTPSGTAIFLPIDATLEP